jgi:2-polyprenyl-3-methyl-5-hydroxy-6-metoxy-1,4-benzoquinol methylase
MPNKKCVICKRNFLHIINLGTHPCADTFLKNQKNAKKLMRYPLKTGYCSCNHLTSIHKVSPNERYTKYNYSYTSGNSPVSRNHFANIAKIITKKYKLNAANSIIEIGSNDGTFLKCIKKTTSLNILGVDPSRFMSAIAIKRGIRTYANFFNIKNSKIIQKKFGKFDLLYAANLLNHIDEPDNFLKSCNTVLKDNGTIILEVPDLDSLIKTCGFDTIYHEHRQYFSTHSIEKVLNRNRYKILSIEKINYMSGSLRVFARKISMSENIIKTKESTMLQKKKFIYNFLNFKKKIFLVRNEILKFIKKFKKNDKIIIGIGAATKGNTLLNFCGIDDKDLKCIIDNSPYKINKFTPGSGIPIVNERKLKNFDAAIILPWNITQYLYKKFLKKKKNSIYFCI